MENFKFCSPTEFIFGKGVEKETGEALKRYGAAKVMIVYGSDRIKVSGLFGEITASLDKLGIAWIEYGGIQPNPTAASVYEGIDRALAEDVTFLLAIGGGSPIDAAKAMALGAVYDGDFWDFYSGKNRPVAALPVGVVLTIPAAGSEGSGNSVITNEKTHQKISVRYPDLLRPRFAIMNPELTYSLPFFQTACGAVDMMAHIFERYFSPTHDTLLVDAYSEAIMRTIMERALELRENGNDYEARADIMWAGTLAHNGLCGVGKVEDWASHRLEHELSAFYDVAHGAGLAVMIPAWMKFCAGLNPGKLRQFAINVMNVEPGDKNTDEIIDEGIGLLKEYYHNLGLTTNLRELVGKEPDVDMLVESLHRNMGDSLGEFVKLSMDDCREIYKLALEG